MLRRRWHVLAVVAVAAATMIVGSVPASSAGAATSAKPAAATVTDKRVTEKTVAEQTLTAHRTGKGVGPDATVSCTLYVTFIQVISPGQAFGPFSPTTVTSLGGVAQVVCTIPVTSLTLDPGLALDGDEVVTGPPVFSSGSNVTPDAFAIDVCFPGDWQVGGTMGIVWPAGFTPPEATATGFGPFLNIDPDICV